MEYEICDEERLFDASTNPSLEKAPSYSRSAFPMHRRGEAAVTLLDDPTEVAIPEEEHQLA